LRLVKSLIKVAGIVAAFKAVSANNITVVIEDIKRRYSLILKINNLFNCLEYLYKNFIKAVVYLRVGLALKTYYVEVWKKGPREG